MNCNAYTLNGLSNICQDSIGGISEVYISPYENLFEVLVDENYVATPVFHRGRYQKLYKFEIRKGCGSLSSTLNTSETSASYFTNSISLTFYKMDTEKRIEMMALSGQDVVVLAKDANGKIWLLSKDEPAQISEATATTGQAKGDANSYTITLSADSAEMPFEVSQDTLDALLTDWATEYLTFEALHNNTDIKFSCNENYFMPIQIKRVGGDTWYTLDSTANESFADFIGLLNAGDKVIVRGLGYASGDGGDWAFFSPDNDVYVYGDIGSLIDEDMLIDYSEDLFELPTPYAFYGLFNDSKFNNSQYVLSHPVKELVIPFGYTDRHAYNQYACMFKGCTSMEYAPRIDLQEWPLPSMDQMSEMFNGCSSLRYVKIDFQIRQGMTFVTNNWLNGVSSNGVFATTNMSNMTVSGSANYIPAGWRRIKL